MKDREFDRVEREMLVRLANELESDRSRSSARRARFTQQVVGRIRSGKRGRKTFWAISAAIVAAAVLFFLLPSDDLESKELELWKLRRSAAPLAFEEQPASRLVADMEGQSLVVMILQYHGERCMWLYPEDRLNLGKDPEEDEAFQRHEKWFVTVEDGSVKLPSDALDRFGQGDLVAIRVGFHVEIWNRAALQRHLSKAPV